MIRRAVFILGVISIFAVSVFAKTAQEKKIIESINTIKTMLSLPEVAIPPLLFQKAEAVAVIPSIYKAGFIFGGRYGEGIIVAKNDKGLYSNPVFIKLIGGSIGLQLGVSKSDIVMVFKTKRSLAGLDSSKLTLGVDASIAAGPTGREAGIEGDLFLESEVYVYAVTKGLYAGLSLAGNSIIVDDLANRRFYGKDVSATDIINGFGITPPPIVKELDKVFN